MSEEQEMATRYILKTEFGGLHWTLVWHPEFDGPIEYYRRHPEYEVIEEEV